MEGLNTSITERRRLTRNRMYQFIYDSPVPVSKQQIANTLGYSLPTVHQNISELMEAGLIKIGEVKKSTGGRPPVGYIIDKDIKFAVGIAVSANYLRIMASDLMQNELAYRQVPLQSFQSETIGRQIKGELEVFFKEARLDTKRLLGVGITVPGVVNRDNDTLTLSPTLKMKNISLGAIKDAIPYPVFIENDSTSGGVAEWLALPIQERDRDFIYLFMENGIGGAIFLNGSPYGGVNHRSGEFGHISVEHGGLKCNCGKTGCLEAYCSAFRFSRDLGITVEEFFEGLNNGNKAYEEIWRSVLEHLAIGINNLRMAFDCDVVLGGFVSEYLEPYMDELDRMIKERNTFEDSGFVRLGKFPRRAGMMGVAWHFTNEFIMSI